MNGVNPLDGFTSYLNGSVEINYAEGCKLWSNDDSGFEGAVSAAEASDAAVVFVSAWGSGVFQCSDLCQVGTWSRDQTLLWSGANATTGEHVDVADLALVGAQLDLIKAVKATGKPTVVVFVSGKPIAEPCIKNSMCTRPLSYTDEPNNH